MRIATNTVWIVLIFGALVVVGGIVLEIFLARRESKWPGLILPGLSFLVSLLPVFSLMAYGGWLENVLRALVLLVMTNLPTLVLLAVYWAAREKLRARSEIKRMNLDDL